MKWVICLSIFILSSCDYEKCIQAAGDFNVSYKICDTEEGIKKVLETKKKHSIAKKKEALRKFNQIADAVGSQPIKKTTDLQTSLERTEQLNQEALYKHNMIFNNTELKKTKQLHKECTSSLVECNKNCNNSKELNQNRKGTQ